jgi:hypothetical protein
MTRWLIPGAGLLVLVVAVAVGIGVWTQQGDSAGACDHNALVQALQEGIRQADTQNKSTFEIDRPASCNDEDQANAVQEVTRNWHMMPGGMMMREATHPGS